MSNLTRVLLVDVGTTRPELNEPLGIETLAGALRAAHGLSATVDLQYRQMQAWTGAPEAGVRSGYDLVGVSTELYSLNRVETLLGTILRDRTGTSPVLVLGGLLATFAPDHFLERHPEVICTLGEGEDALRELVQLVIHGGGADHNWLREEAKARQVPNLAFLSNGRLVRTPRKLVDLTTSPMPSRDFLPSVISNRGIVRIEGSRGCPWGKCSFCAISAKYGAVTWRPVPLRRIVQELEAISRVGGRSPYFTDEDFFGSDPERALTIAEAVISAKEAGRIRPDLDFYVNLPANMVANHRSKLQRLKEAGLREVFVGIESGARGQISRYGKLATKEKNIVALDTLRGLRLTMDIGFIMFDPEMSFEELEENAAFLEEARLVDHDARDIKRVRVEPGTELEVQLRKKGTVTLPLDVDSLTFPYQFKDERVGRVHEMFRTWEDATRELVYLLQAKTRGEVPSESLRIELKGILGQLRALDYSFLKSCIAEAALAPGEPSTFSTEAEPLSRERDALISRAGEVLSSA